MNKKVWIIFFVIAILAAIGIFIYVQNNSENSNNNNQSSEANPSYEADRTSSNDNTQSSENQPQENSVSVTQNIAATEPEKEIAAFSTKIYTKDPARQNNIAITCNTLNGTIVKNGETFSFCNTVGQASSSKGYQKADIFDNNGNKKKGLGGGNCQISSTLYNAVLAVPSLVVTERHAHSNYVPYIQKGKDAAVAYGSYDLKFRNDSGKNVKILAEQNPDAVTVRLMQ